MDIRFKFKFSVANFAVNPVKDVGKKHGNPAFGGAGIRGLSGHRLIADPGFAGSETSSESRI